MRFRTPYLTLPPPANFKPSDYNLFEKINDWERQSDKVRRLRNVKVFYEGYFLIRNKIDKDSFFGKQNTSIGRRQRLNMIFQKPEKKIFKAVWPTDAWGEGYYHWMVDTLQRYFICTNGKNDTQILLPSNYKNQPFIVESLKSLEIPVLWVSNSKPVKVEELLLPPFIKPRGTCNPKYIKKLSFNLRAMSFIKNKVKKKAVYISREKASRRKVKNESEVLKIMKKFKIDIFYMEEMNWNEQMQLMANTNILFSLHGAGLANALIMPKGAKMLEIRMSTGFNQVCYYELAGALSIDYYYLKADPVSSNDSPGYGDCLVNTVELEQTVYKMLK